MQQNEQWNIEEDKLVVRYNTLTGVAKEDAFVFAGKNKDGALNFVKPGTKRYLKDISWNNLTQCYTALYNTTSFSAFITCDLSSF